MNFFKIKKAENNDSWNFIWKSEDTNVSSAVNSVSFKVLKIFRKMFRCDFLNKIRSLLVHTEKSFILLVYLKNDT